MYRHFGLNRTAKKMNMKNRDYDEHDQHLIYNSLWDQILIWTCLDWDTLLKLWFQLQTWCDSLIAQLLDEHQKSKSHKEIYERRREVLKDFTIFTIL